MTALRWTVAAVVLDRAGRVLLCRQAGSARRWALPGGRLRHDESPSSAVVRAIRAETGWDADLVDLVGLYRLGAPDTPPPPAGHCGAPPDVLVHVFRARVHDPHPAAEPVDGCRPAWHPPDAVPAALTPTTRAALADALAGRSGVVRQARTEPAATAPDRRDDGTATDAAGTGEHAAGTGTPPGEHDGSGTPPGQRAAGALGTGRR